MAFSFRIRAPERDRAADEIRFEQVLDIINKTRADIARESSGLRERCEKARCSASFALEAVEGVTRDAALDRRIRNLSDRSEEHTSELQSRENLVCRLLLEKKKSK